MKKKNINMTSGPLWSNIMLFSLPLIASNLLQVMFNLSDLAVVGRFGGAEALGSVGSTVNMVVMFTGLLMGLGSGVNALTALLFGAGSKDEVRETVHTSFLVCLIAGLTLLVLCIGLSGPLLKVLNTKDELFDGARLYLHIYFVSMPAVALYNFGNGVYSAVGNTRRPLTFLSLAGVLNVALNLLFVIVFKMGVAGVALASVISQYLSASLIVISLFKTDDCYGLKLKYLKLSREKASRLLHLGVPAGLQNAIFQVANMFIQAGVNTFDAVVVEGNSAAANADGIVYDVMAAFYVACTSFISQNYGAGQKKRMIKSYYIALFYSFAFGIGLGLLIYLFGPEFLSVFATDEEVIEAGMMRLSVMALSYGFSAFMDNTIAASRGLGKTVVPTVIVILGSCVFRVIWVYTIFAYYHTIHSLYLLYIFSWSITAIFEILYFAREWHKISRTI